VPGGLKKIYFNPVEGYVRQGDRIVTFYRNSTSRKIFNYLYSSQDQTASMLSLIEQLGPKNISVTGAPEIVADDEKRLIDQITHLNNKFKKQGITLNVMKIGRKVQLSWTVHFTRKPNPKI
jgi:hypothetical protein